MGEGETHSFALCHWNALVLSATKQQLNFMLEHSIFWAKMRSESCYGYDHNHKNVHAYLHPDYCFSSELSGSYYPNTSHTHQLKWHHNWALRLDLHHSRWSLCPITCMPLEHLLVTSAWKDGWRTITLCREIFHLLNRFQWKTPKLPCTAFQKHGQGRSGGRPWVDTNWIGFQLCAGKMQLQKWPWGPISMQKWTEGWWLAEPPHWAQLQRMILQCVHMQDPPWPFYQFHFPN